MVIMKFIVRILLISTLISSSSFAQKLLNPPNGQSPQCDQAYRSADQPKTANNIFNSISSACHYAGGMRVMHKVLASENSNEPTGVLFTCIGNDPSFVFFSCLFSTSFADL